MVNQISIFAENQKGAVRAITRIFSDADTAGTLLTAAGYQIKQTPVMAVGIPDEPGSLDRLLQKIESANINIDYLYTSFDRDSARPVIAIHADDMDELEEFLTASGFQCRHDV